MFDLKREHSIISKGLACIFSSFFYLGLTIVLAILTAFAFFKLASIPGQSIDSWLFSITEVTKWFVAIYSILLGLLLSIQVYIYKNFGFHLRTSGKTAAGVIPGLLSGIAGIACCAPAIAGLVALFGAGSVGFISTHQIWFAIPSILLMLVALRFSLRAVADPTCR